jgi:signal transduction histidine kinase
MSSLTDPAGGRATWPDRIGALLRAALSLGSELELDSGLSRIVESAAQVASARYAALGIYGDDGEIARFVHYGIDEETVALIGGLPQGRGLLGEVIVADGPIRRDDIAADPRSCGFPPHHPPMRSFLGVPIARGGRRYGNLYLTEKMGGIAFDAEDEALVVTLAAFAAVALENARLLEAERVEAVALVDLAAAEERNRVRQETLGLVIAAQEAERSRVARDLHDDIGQALTSVLLGLRLIDGALDDDQLVVADLRSRVGELREVVVSALHGARQLAFELRPIVLDDVGLLPALERLVAHAIERSELRVDLTADVLKGAKRLPQQVETVVYRVVQESLTNVVRHARAQRVSIVVAVRDRRLRAVVEDDGVGFDPAATERTLGLRGMSERASLAGGWVEVTASLEAGTTVVLEVPLA